MILEWPSTKIAQTIMFGPFNTKAVQIVLIGWKIKMPGNYNGYSTPPPPPPSLFHRNTFYPVLPGALLTKIYVNFTGWFSSTMRIYHSDTQNQINID